MLPYLPYNTQTSPSVYSVTLYLTLCGINMLYRNRNLEFFFFAQFFSAQFPPPLEWWGTHALSLTSKLHNLKKNVMLFLHQMNFYLWSLRHIVVLILSHAACFLHLNLKCSCSPYAFFFHFKHCCIAIVVTCTVFFYIWPLNMLFKMPHKSKGPSSCLRPKRNRTHRVSTATWKVYLRFESVQSRRGEENHQGIRRSGLLAAAQPIKREEELTLLCLLYECGIFPYLRWSMQ